MITISGESFAIGSKGILSLGISRKSAMVIMQHNDISSQSTSKGEKMQRKYNPQMSLFAIPSSKPIARKLEQISVMLDENRKLVEIVYEDLIRAKRADNRS
jgi:hypothetical protein